MHLPTTETQLRHVNTVTHDGKVVVFATASGGEIWYTVKQDGFEDSYLNTPEAERTGWEVWRQLPLPGAQSTAVDQCHDRPDQSVLDKEAAELTYTDDDGTTDLFHRSLYDSASAGADAPVKLVSGMGHLYVFRHAKQGTLLVDRFVLDGVTNVLVRKLEVRFKRSRQRYTPSGSMKRGEKGLTNVDSLDFRDIEGVPFFEPTTELRVVALETAHDGGGRNLGWFSVVLVPTAVHDQYHWHIFAHDPDAESIVLTSIRASEDGLFDVRDRVGLSDEDKALGMRRWGIVRRPLALSAEGEHLTVVNGFDAVKYDVQVARRTGDDNETQLHRAQTRVMLSVPVSGGSTAVVSFAVATDGSLSRIDTEPSGTTTPLRRDEHELMLPLDTLDQVKAWAQPDPPPGGPVAALGRDREDQVVVTAEGDVEGDVEVGDLVQLENPAGLDRYVQTPELIDVGALATAIVRGESIDHIALVDGFNGRIPAGTRLRIDDGARSLVVSVIDEVEPGGSLIAIEPRVSTVDIPAWATIVYADVFLIPADQGRDALGQWKKIEDEEHGLIFDGIITGFETGGDTVAINAPGHGLMPGDAVQIANTSVPEGAAVVTSVDGSRISLQADFHAGEAINVTRATQHRRALQLNTALSYVETPELELDDPRAGMTTASTYQAWVFVPADSADNDRLLIGQKDDSFRLELKDRIVGLNLHLHDGVYGLPDDDEVLVDQWVHYAVTIESSPFDPVDPDRSEFGTVFTMYRDGVEVARSGKDDGVLESPCFLIEKLQAEGTAVGESFGWSVAIEGDTAVVGDAEDGSSGSNSGRAFIYTHDGETWSEAQPLVAEDAASDDYFGCSVAIEGDTVLVGAFGKGPDLEQAGAVYVFRRNGLEWQQVQRLQPDDRAQGDEFGRAVAIKGDTALIGAYGKTGYDDRLQRDATEVGAAYVFTRTAGEWSQTQKLEADDRQQTGYFGYSVALQDSVAMIGANGADDGVGAVYVYTRPFDQWVPQQRLNGDERAVGFGGAIAIDGHSALIGASQTDLPAPRSGSVCLFIRTGSTWVFADVLQPDDATADAEFGWSVAIEGSTAVIGARWNGRKGENAGAAYLFRYGDDGWTQAQRLDADQEKDDTYGGAVAISGDVVLVGAEGSSNGAAYLFGTQRVAGFHIGGEPDRLGSANAGSAIRVADVQIWNRERDADEIKNTMFVRLSGREPGLVGYWRMGGIVAGDHRTVPDFSAAGHDAFVHGDAFVSAAVFDRTLRDGTTEAIKYLNDDLIGVEQRATYIESVEFRTGDGEDDAAFAFSYWGKASRGADEVVHFPHKDPGQRGSAGAPTEFTVLADGWTRAACTFEVPDEVSLIRAFEISELEGEWASLQVRNHQLTMISNVITRATYDDSLALEVRKGRSQSGDQLAEVLPHERNEAALDRTVRDLNKQVAEAQASFDASEAVRSARIADLTSQIQAATNVLSGYAATLDSCRASLAVATQDPRNYWCVLRNRSNIGLIARVYTDGHALLYADVGANGNPFYANNLFKFVPTDDTYFKIVCSMSNLSMRAVPLFVGFGSMDQLARVYGYANHDGGTAQEWSVEHQPSGNYLICNRAHPTLALAAGSQHIYAMPKSGGTEQQFVLERQGGEANGLIAAARTTYNAAAVQVRAQQDEVARLQRLLAAANVRTSESALNALKALRDQAVAELARVRYVLAELTTPYLDAMRTQLDAQTMSEIHKDDRALKTTGAVLEFARPVSRINAIESFEGAVQLSYFDKHGGLKRTCFDALADADNATFDEWIPDDARACIDLAHDDSALVLDTTKPLTMSGDWTFECWIRLPLPDVEYSDRTLLLGEVAGAHQRIVSAARDGVFRTSANGHTDLDQSTLAPGWHHLSVVVRRKGTSSLAMIAIDGTKAGAEVAVASEATITKIGNFPGKEQFGQIAEARFWNCALTDAELAANRHSPLTGNEPDLEAYFPMSEGDADLVRDHTGNGHNGTLVNGRWAVGTAPIGRVGEPVAAFNGRTDGLVLPTLDELNVSPYEWTFEMWVNLDDLLTDVCFAFSRLADIGLYLQHVATDRFGPYNLHMDGVTLYADDSPVVPKLQRRRWLHLAVTLNNNEVLLYIDGTLAGGGGVADGNRAGSQQVRVGTGADGTDFFRGEMAEVRLWDYARSGDEIAEAMLRRLTGNEHNLAGYWPLSVSGAASSTPNLAAGKVALAGTLTGTTVVSDTYLALAHDGVAMAEYSAYDHDVKTASATTPMLRRMYVYPTRAEPELVADQRIDTLVARWVGNAQFKPTLLGYIEGAPPIPSENLTVEEDYDGATSVELAVSDDVEFSWNRAKESAWGATGEFFVGVETEADQGITVPMVGQVASFKVASAKGGAKGDISSSHGDTAETTVGASSSSEATDKLELVGWREHEPKFANLGNRFIPKNVGYALVVSGLADVWITRMRKSGRMVGYDIRPNPDVPPDINTITFMINPAYTMNGSLDGQTGTAATSDRFFRHVPEMRAQFGSAYPASYLRLGEAYDLKHQIELQDTNREAYFYNFNAAVSKLIGDGDLDDEIDNTQFDTKPVALERAEDKPTTGDDSVALTDEQKEAANKAKQAAAQRRLDEMQGGTQGKIDQSTAEAKKKREEIETIRDGSARRQAMRKFDAWQTRMEALRVRAGKRNIVNTYVWDADGGLRSEQQQFASTIEHSLGSEMSLDAALGAEGNFGVFGATVELTAQATFGLTQTLTKTENRSTGMELRVDLDGVERSGITDYKDRPLLPGEKVDRYRFMSFYLENSTKNFEDFFGFVVDPEWLASNDEGARALRQAKGKANKTWRVLHRVTYVERPALMGFGADRRTLPVRHDLEKQALSKLDELELQLKEVLRIVRGE